MLLSTVWFCNDAAKPTACVLAACKVRRCTSFSTFPEEGHTLMMKMVGLLTSTLYKPPSTGAGLVVGFGLQCLHPLCLTLLPGAHSSLVLGCVPSVQLIGVSQLMSTAQQRAHRVGSESARRNAYSSCKSFDQGVPKPAGCSRHCAMHSTSSADSKVPIVSLQADYTPRGCRQRDGETNTASSQFAVWNLKPVKKHLLLSVSSKNQLVTVA